MQRYRRFRVGLMGLLGCVGLTLSGVASAGVFTIDDGDAGYSQTGSWTTESRTYTFNGDERYQSTPGDASTATWSFSDLPSGKYYLATSYYFSGNRTTDAQYVMSDGVPTAHINQVPNLYDLGGKGTQGIYRRLSNQVWSITDGTFDATVSNAAGANYLMADSIRLETAATDALEVFVVDDRYTFEGRPGYSTTGSWTGENVNHTDSEDWSNQAGATATFDFTGLPDGYYRVSTTWKEGGNRSTDAVFTMSDGVGAVSVNQQAVPTDETFDNVGWKMLDPVVHIEDGDFSVVLSNNDRPNFIMADAIRLERFDAQPGVRLRDPSFEYHVLNDDGWTGTPTHWSDIWTTNKNSGVYNPTGEPVTPRVPDGSNVGFLNRSGWLAQTLETLEGEPLFFEAGDVYTITIDAVSRNGLETLLDVDLRNSSNQSIVGGLQRQTAGTNDYITLTYQFTIDADTFDPVLVLQNSHQADQLWLDNVNIAAPLAVVPEPSSLILSAFGFLGLGYFIRRRK